MAQQPQNAANFEPQIDAKAVIARINDISGYARGTWIALLSVLVFSGITLLGVEDVDFFAAESKTDLPLVGVSVPVTYFFGAGAVLVAAAYIYFHLYLELLWTVLGKAPAEIGGAPLSESISPWLIVEWALRRRDRLTGDQAQRQNRPAPPRSAAHRALAWVGSLMSILFVWLFGPLVLGYFWWRSMPAHIDWMTVLLGLVFAFALWTSWRSWRAATRLFAGQPSALLLIGPRRILGNRLKSAAGFAALAVALTAVSLIRTASEWLPGEHPLARDYGEGKKAEWVELYNKDKFRTKPTHVEYWQRRRDEAATIDDRLQYFADRFYFEFVEPFSVSASLVGAQLVTLPKDWTSRAEAEREFRALWAKREGIDYVDPFPSSPMQRSAAPVGEIQTEDEDTFESRFQAAWMERRETYLNTLTKPMLEGSNLRRAQLQLAFLPGVSLRNARLEGATIAYAKLEGANLSGAHLEGASLLGTNLQGANLSGTHLDGAYLDSARLEGADLSGARLTSANLSNARLEDADLSNSILDGVDFSTASLDGADLTNANLEGAKLSAASVAGTDFSSAKLKDARLNGANLKGTTFFGADLEGTNFSGAILQAENIAGASLNGADLSSASLEGTNLSNVSFEGADFRGARLSGRDGSGLLLHAAVLEGNNFAISAFRHADLGGVMLANVKNFASAFGDASVILPMGARWPCHWGRQDEGKLTDVEFFGRWRGWVEKLGMSNQIWVGQFENHLAIAPPPECPAPNVE